MKDQNSTRNAQRRRVDSERLREKRFFLQVIALLYALWLIILLGVGIWMAASPSDSYALTMAGEELDHKAIGKFKDFFETEFGRDQLTVAASSHPKAVFLAQYAGLFAARLFVLWALWLAAGILEKTEAGEYPLTDACGELFRVLRLVISAVFVRVFVPRLFTWIAGGGRFGLNLKSYAVFLGLFVAYDVLEHLQDAFAYKLAQSDEADEQPQDGLE